MYVCGTYLVMLAAPPGVSGSSATRSLFGGTSGLSSLKSKRSTAPCGGEPWRVHPAGGGGSRHQRKKQCFNVEKQNSEVVGSCVPREIYLMNVFHLNKNKIVF